MESIPILCYEFSRLSSEKQDDEIGKLFTILGGIEITRHSYETDRNFRNRAFRMAIKKLPINSEYENHFFDNIIIPSLLNDFRESSSGKKKMLLDKLAELSDGSSNKRKSDESKHDFIDRFCLGFLPLPLDSKYKMVEFSQQVIDLDDKWAVDEIEDMKESQIESIDVGISYPIEKIRGFSPFMASQTRHRRPSPSDLVRRLKISEDNQIRGPNPETNFSSILYDELRRMRTEKLDEEIRNFLTLLGAPITRDDDESDEDFNNRSFKMAFEMLPLDSQFEREFLENRIIPSLVEDFEDSSVDKQKRLMHKLSELTDGLSVKRKSDESEDDFRIRFYSRLLPTLLHESKDKMIKFLNHSVDRESNSYILFPAIRSLRIPQGQPGFNPELIRSQPLLPSPSSTFPSQSPSPSPSPSPSMSTTSQSQSQDPSPKDTESNMKE
ncbi:hypothetical protein M5689_020991 [Euphorbia peplus]|nr:hypothetical protein M5689_020991 [Euphorbia peplus]